MMFGAPFLLEHGSVEEACYMTRELGLDFLELNSNFPACQVDGMTVESLLALQAKYGIAMTLHIEEDCDPFTFQPRVRSAWLASVVATLQLARAANIRIINMHMPHGVYMTLPTRRVYMYDRYQAEYDQALHAFRQLCEGALQGSDVRIAIENTNGFQHHEQRAINFLLASPVFGLTLDIGHLHCNGEADLPFYQRHQDRLIHMHAHDARGRQDHLPFGEGDIDLPARLAWAERDGATVLLEVKTRQALGQTVQWLRQGL